MKKYYKINNAHESVICAKCGYRFKNAATGTSHRNHCPRCLWSLHIDNKIGDRKSECKGLMEPVSVWIKKNDEWAIIHRCTRCGILRANRIAGDDNEFILLSLSVKPLAKPPFPLEHLKY